MAAVAHVAAEPTGIAFVPQPEQQVFYDEAAGLLHLVEGRMITAVALPGHASGGSGSAAALWASPPPGGAAAASSGHDSDSSAASSTERAFLVSEGPPVRLIRSSLDGAFTALHRSARLVELHCHHTGCMFVEAAGADRGGRKGGDPNLLGFFWTAAHLVMVTGGGLEVHSVHPSRQALRLDSTVPLQGVQWYTYSPETHMVVLGFGSSGAKLQAIQFSRAGTLKLPLLDLTPPWGSPIRPAVAAAVSAALDGFAAATPAPPRLVGPDTCWVVVLYGRVFCCHHDRRAGVLRLYRLFRDATSLAHCYDVYARQLELSVVDNVLLVHHIDTAVVMLVDIMAPGAAPISSPLPLAVALPDAAPAVGQPDSGPSEAPGTAGQEASPARHVAPEPAARQLPVSTSGGRTPAALPAAPAVAYALHYPAWLVDGSAGLVYRLQLDLRAVADSQASDAPRLLAFLQRRRASGAARRDAAGITLRVLRGLVQDEAPLPLLRSCFDIVNSFAEAAARPQQPDSGAASGASSAASSGRASPLPAGVRPASPSPALVAAAHQQQPVVTPEDVHHSVFALLRAQGAAAPAQLRAGLCEYLGSRHARGLGAAPCLAALYVDCLLEEGLPHLVAPLLLSHPQLDSAQLAEHLEEAAAAGRLPGGAQLAEQLLLRLGAHEAHCRLLLRRGAPRRALALARQERLVGALAPEALLEAAASGDALLFAAAHRVCSAAAQRPGEQPLARVVEAHRSRFAPAQLAMLQAAVR